MSSREAHRPRYPATSRGRSGAQPRIIRSVPRTFSAAGRNGPSPCPLPWVQGRGSDAGSDGGDAPSCDHGAGDTTGPPVPGTPGGGGEPGGGVVVVVVVVVRRRRPRRR